MNEFVEKVRNAETILAYEEAVKALAEALTEQGMAGEAQKLREIAILKGNRFSAREAEREFAEKKEAVADYGRLLISGRNKERGDIILTILKYFPLFCRNLYVVKFHERCSAGLKQHLTGLRIENEYDLQRLMLAVLSTVFPDARTESVQDSGHHEVRKDIVIDSESTVIELKCTRNNMTERQLSEEVASDMIHYKADNLYFYIYDKAGIIKNIDSFKRTYEERDVDGKSVHVMIYNHNDL